MFRTTVFILFFITILQNTYQTETSSNSAEVKNEDNFKHDNVNKNTKADYIKEDSKAVTPNETRNNTNGDFNKSSNSNIKDNSATKNENKISDNYNDIPRNVSTDKTFINNNKSANTGKVNNTSDNVNKTRPSWNPAKDFFNAVSDSKDFFKKMSNIIQRDPDDSKNKSSSPESQDGFSKLTDTFFPFKLFK